MLNQAVAAAVIAFFARSVVADSDDKIYGSIAGQYCLFADSYLSCTLDTYPVINPFQGSEFHLADAGCWKGAGEYDLVVSEEMHVSIEADNQQFVSKVSLTCGSDDAVVYTQSDFVSSNQVTWKCSAASGYAVLYCDGKSTIEVKYLYYGGKTASGGLCYFHDNTCPSALKQVKATSTKTANIALPTPYTSTPIVGKCVPNTIEEVCEIVNDPLVNPFTGLNFYITGSGSHSALASDELNVSFTMQNNILKSVTISCTGQKDVLVAAGSLGIEVDFFSACGSAGWVHLLDMETYIDMKQIWYYGNTGTGGLCYGSMGTCTLVKTVSTTAAVKTTLTTTAAKTTSVAATTKTTTAVTSAKPTSSSAKPTSSSAKPTSAATTAAVTYGVAATTTPSAAKTTSTAAATYGVPVATTTTTPMAAAVTAASASTSTVVRYTYVAPGATTTSKNLLNSDAAGARLTAFSVFLLAVLVA
ncbi:hypothetical protein HDU82_000566 [Entophlyctis luteolus]|nr:hypothetical protein HDU82_000566 [Entophlyctis luteolus]KAJ3382566.1 hypothetical protein HDU84_004209 [Entophlyctis sp. JEL0112]